MDSREVCTPPLSAETSHLILGARLILFLKSRPPPPRRLLLSCHSSTCDRFDLPPKVDASKELDPNLGYIQVTFVKQARSHGKEKDRATEYEQNVDINTFMYETPFTKSGKARGLLSEQYLRKTYLTVEKRFPYMKTRLRVIEVRRMSFSNGCKSPSFLLHLTSGFSFALILVYTPTRAIIFSHLWNAY